MATSYPPGPTQAVLEDEDGQQVNVDLRQLAITDLRVLAALEALNEKLEIVIALLET